MPRHQRPKDAQLPLLTRSSSITLLPATQLQHQLQRILKLITLLPLIISRPQQLQFTA